MCAHPVDKRRFLECTCADRLPGVWVCDECGFSQRAKLPATPVATHSFKRTSGLLMARTGHPIREDTP
jgi:hypothetical protein